MQVSVKAPNQAACPGQNETTRDREFYVPAKHIALKGFDVVANTSYGNLDGAPCLLRLPTFCHIMRN